MLLKDLHVHTNYCDGKDSPRDIVLAAVGMGMKTLGFSGHGYTDFDEYEVTYLITAFTKKEQENTLPPALLPLPESFSVI